MSSYNYGAVSSSSPLGYYVAGGIYFVLLLVFVFFSISTAWILIKHGRSRLFATTVAVIYMVIFFGLITQGFSILSTIKSIS